MFACLNLLGNTQVDGFICHNFGIDLFIKGFCNLGFFNNLLFTFLLLCAFLYPSSARTYNGVLFLPFFPSHHMIQIAK